MKLSVDQRLPPSDAATFNQRLTDLLTQTARQVNALTEGSISSQHGARINVPTSGVWKNGDVVRNSNPTLVTPGSACCSWPDGYVVYGWMCIDSGEPGTWTEMRFGYFAPTTFTFDYLLHETGFRYLREDGFGVLRE